MKYSLRLLTIIAFAFLNLTYALAQSPFKPYPEISKKFPAPEAVLNNSAQGKDFWIAIPLNDHPSVPINAIEIYVTSSSNTVVTLEVPGQGFSAKKALKALDVVTFSTKNGTISPAWEVSSSEVPDNIAIHVFAAAPISVYVLNAKPVTSEGYLALPTSVWGTEYVHCSFYDFNEARAWATGMCIIASEDNTDISILLRGKGATSPNGKTAGGAKIGQTLKATLMKGQIYNVKGNAATRGVFDMSGSKITANKPIGLISYQERCMIPANNVNGRDHIVEMLPPVQAWGKKYTTVEYERDNKGDYFRIIASQNNTRWKMKYYDKKTKVLIGQRDGILNAGQFFEEYTNYVGRGLVESIRGTSVWEADKPVLVLQYSYSANWDMGDQFDPFFILVTPQEQFIQATVFQSPANSAFSTNWFNIIAEGDTNDPAGTKLKSIELDGKAIWLTKPTLLSNNIPGTNLYWQSINVKPGPHRLKSETRFGGYVYGFSDFDSYGWPAAMAIKKLDEVDTLPPVLTFEEECGDFTYTATELRNFGPPPDTAQIDQGIAIIELIDSVSTNYEMEYITADRLVVDPKVTTFQFKLKVIDKTKDAFAYFTVLDRAGNYVIDSVKYVVDKLSLNPDPVNFGKVRVNTTKEMKVKIKNESTNEITLKEIKTKINKLFKIVSVDTTPLKAGEEREVTVSYTPDKESLDDKSFDIDSLMAKTECVEFIWPLKGLGVRPCIMVEQEWNAGRVPINNKICKNEVGSLGLRITNKGSDTLTIVGINGVKAPFTVSSPTVPAFPFKIAPKSDIYFNAVCFAPTEEKSDSITVTFDSDSWGDDCSPTSLWYGTGIQPGLVITDQDWLKRRQGTVMMKEVYVTNSGSSPANVTKVELATPASPHFRIININPPVSDAAPYILRNDGSKITVQIEYEPQTEFDHQTTITASANNAGNATGTLKGYGFLPKIEATGYEFMTPVLVGSYAGTDGEVVIKNTSTSSPLLIESLNFSASGPNASDFEWKNPGALPSNSSIAIGGELRVPVRFKPTAIGKRITAVDIKNDAAPGSRTVEEPRIITNVDVIGNGIETRYPDIKVTDIDYNNVILCDQPYDTAYISNPGTDDLIIGNMSVSGADAAYFSIGAHAYPFTIKPNERYAVAVQFKPDVVRPYVASIIVTPTNLKDAQGNIKTGTIQLNGTGYTVPVEFSINPSSYQGKKPGETIAMTIKGSTLSGTWAQADLKAVNFKIAYQGDRMLYELGSLKPASGMNGWNLVPNETATGLDITATGTNAISGGDLFTLTFKVLISDTAQYGIDLTANTLTRSVCTPVSTKPSMVTLAGCFINGRLVSFSGNGFALKGITPNPVQADEVAIHYSIGFKVHATIDIYNSLGEKVATAVNHTLEPGEYKLSMPMNLLPNGNYFCRINAGPFVEVQPFTINK